MPIVNASDPKVWVEQYKMYLNHPTDRFGLAVMVGFIRAKFLWSRKRRGQKLVKLLDFRSTQTIMLVGAAFGWTGEGIIEVLPTAQVFGVDNSTYIQANKDKDESAEIIEALRRADLNPDSVGAPYIEAYKGEQRSRLEILDVDMLDLKAVELLHQSRHIDWAISEDVLPWLNDSEALELDRNMRRISVNVAHVVTPYMEDQTQYPEHPIFSSYDRKALWNWKTVEDWHLLLGSRVLSVGELT